ncbi:MAG TPA: hypothetical protein VGG84_05945 [Gemmatimonadaceae bacterium]
MRIADAESRAEGDERAPVAQWLALGIAPVAFAAHLQIGYVLIPWSCTTGQHVWLHVVNVASIGLSLCGTLLGWRVARRAADAPHDGGGPVPRTRFIGDVSVGVSALLTLILLAQSLAALVISPCQ